MRKIIPLGVVLCLVFAVLASFLASAQGLSERAAATVPSAYAAAQASPSRIEIALQAGSAPVTAVDASGALWVNAHRAAVLFRVDPATNTVETIPVPTNQCAFSAAPDLLWFTNCGPTGFFPNPGPPTSFGFDPAARAVVRQFPYWSGYAGGSLWTAQGDATQGQDVTLVRNDPQTGAEQARVPLQIIPSSNGSAGTECYGSLWTVNALNNVQRTDLATNTGKAITLKSGRRPTSGLPDTNFACLDAKVWVPNGLGLFRIDPKTNATKLFPVKISSERAWSPVSIASDGHDLFVRNLDTSVARIDPRTGKVVQRYPADTGGGTITVAYGSLWVINPDHDTLWRYPL